MNFAAPLNLEGKSPSELEHLRNQFAAHIREAWASKLDEVPVEILQNFALVTSAIRRGTAGPPKSAKKDSSGKKRKPSATELLNSI